MNQNETKNRNHRAKKKPIEWRLIAIPKMTVHSFIMTFCCAIYLSQYIVSFTHTRTSGADKRSADSDLLLSSHIRYTPT